MIVPICRRLTFRFKVFTYLHKSYLRNTMGQTRSSSIVIIKSMQPHSSGIEE